MLKKRLGVNIDHVATIRNARGESFTQILLQAALIVEEAGADSINYTFKRRPKTYKGS